MSKKDLTTEDTAHSNGSACFKVGNDKRHCPWLSDNDLWSISLRKRWFEGWEEAEAEENGRKAQQEDSVLVEDVPLSMADLKLMSMWLSCFENGSPAYKDLEEELIPHHEELNQRLGKAAEDIYLRAAALADSLVNKDTLV